MQMKKEERKKTKLSRLSQSPQSPQQPSTSFGFGVVPKMLDASPIKVGSGFGAESPLSSGATGLLSGSGMLGRDEFRESLLSSGPVFSAGKRCLFV